MKLTRRQKALIRAHYSSFRLRFMASGEVMAQKSKGGAWSLLYTSRDTINHLVAIGAIPKAGD